MYKIILGFTALVAAILMSVSLGLMARGGVEAHKLVVYTMSYGTLFILSVPGVYYILRRIGDVKQITPEVLQELSYDGVPHNLKQCMTRVSSSRETSSQKEG